MRNKQHELAELKFKVFSNKRDQMQLRLKNQEQVEYLRELGVSVKPFIYLVKADFPRGYMPQNSTPGIVKAVFYEFRNHHRYQQFRELSPNQARALKKAGLFVREYKYRVVKESSSTSHR